MHKKLQIEVQEGPRTFDSVKIALVLGGISSMEWHNCDDKKKREMVTILAGHGLRDLFDEMVNGIDLSFKLVERDEPATY